jgi:hypothetical protein
MARYVWRDGRFRDPATGDPMPMPAGDSICCPLVLSDIAEYRSPIDGRPISSRSTRREDLKRNDCVEAEPRKPRGYRNPKFALKRGLPLNEEARDTVSR